MKLKKNLWGIFFALFLCLFCFPAKTEANSLLTAKPISLGSSISGELTTTEKIYFYQFDLPSSGQFQFLNFTSDMDRFGFSLYNESKERLDYYTLFTNGGVPGTGSYTFQLSKGRYYLRIIGNYASYDDGKHTGPYSFRTAFTSAGVNHNENSNVIQNAVSIGSGTTIKGHFSMTDQVDFYKITLPTPGILDIQKIFKCERMGTRIYDTNYEPVTGNTMYWQSASEQGSGTESYYLAAGTYYIRMISNYYNYDEGRYTGAYQFTPRFTSAGVNHTEPSSTLQTAYPVTLNQRINGFIALNDMADYYRLTLTKAIKLRITVSCYLERLGLEFYDSSYRKIEDTGFTFYWDSASQSKTETKELELAAGTYYVRVIGDSYYSDESDYLGRYQLTFQGPATAAPKIDIDNAAVSSISTQTYNGKALKPKVKIKYAGKKLYNEKDYTITYKKNKYPGKATVTIKGIGKYTGSRTISFYIKPAKEKITYANTKSRRRVTLKYEKASKVSGYQICYSTKKGKGYKVLKNTTKTSCTVKLPSKRSYYFRVRSFKKVGNTVVYGSLSSPKKIRVR